MELGIINIERTSFSGVLYCLYRRRRKATCQKIRAAYANQRLELASFSAIHYTATHSGGVGEGSLDGGESKLNCGKSHIDVDFSNEKLVCWCEKRMSLSIPRGAHNMHFCGTSVN